MSTKVWHQREGTGPVHLATAQFYYQAWCGKRPQFRHQVRPGSPEEVTCKTCLARMKIGSPQARR